MLVSCAALLGASVAAHGQVVVGGDTEPGFVEVRDTGGANALIFEVDDDVRVGSSGPSAVDADLVVYDPSHPVPKEEAFVVDANNAFVVVGSGTTSFPGSDGDLILRNGTGLAAVTMNGAAADVFLGYDGGDGDLVMRRTSGADTVFLSGNSAGLTLGGGGTAGDIFIRDGAAVNTFVVDGITGDVSNALAGEGLAKAWCRVRGDGSIIAGYRCTSVNRIGSGLYFVDFTALATDITSRPFLASCTSEAAAATCQDVRASYSSDDLSRIVVTADTADDGAFTLVIF